MKRTPPSPRTTKTPRWIRTVTSRSEAETERIAARFAKTLRGGEVILLDGDLGAGKTAFVRGLARGLNIHDRITSPTFVLMRVHQAASRQPSHFAKAPRDRQAASTHTRQRCPKCRKLGACSCQLVAWFVHVDAYRVHDASALEAIGLLEWVGRTDAVVAIEWGARAQPLFRGRRIRRVSITPRTKNPNVRSIRIS